MRLGSMSFGEQLVRGVLGGGLLAVYFALYPSATWALVGIVPLATALLNFCPMYALCQRRAVAAAATAAGEASAQLSVSTQQLEAAVELPASAPGPDEAEAEAEEDEEPAEATAEQADPPAPVHDRARPARARARRASDGRVKKARSKKRKAARSQARRRAARKTAAPSGTVVHANDATFRSLVLESDQPVLVDFWADWCGPCQAIAPLLDEVAAEQAGRARVVKVNVDDNPATAGQLGIRSIPTLVLFKDGQVADVLVGLQTKAKLSRVLAQAAG
jgi:thioredoxin 1